MAIWVILQLPLWLGAVPLLLKLASGSISSYGFLNHPDFLLAVITASISVALSLIVVVVQLVLHGRKGVTIGKAITGIRSVNVRTLERPGVGAVLLRYLIVMAAGIVPVVGSALILVTPTFDPDRRGRGWHDRAAGVWLVDVRRGLDPYDEKRMRIARKTASVDPLPERPELPSLATARDPSARPEYRPGSRISAGVLGVARSEDGPGLPVADPVAPAPPAPQVPAPARPGLVRAAPVPAPVVRRPAPSSPAPSSPVPASQAAAPVVSLSLRLDTGDSIPVTAPVILGRNPDSADHPGVRVVALADESRSLSKTHLLVRPVDGGLEVVDWHSTNGSGLVSGGVERVLPPGVPVSAVAGDRIMLGDRVADVVIT